MSEPVTRANSKPPAGEEINVDLQSTSTSGHQTQCDENIPEISVLAGEVNETLQTDTEQPEKFRAVPIHRRPDLLVPCADLVNSEWQRSQAARVHSLQKSCPEFPVSMVLLQGHKETERLLGHVRMSLVIGDSKSLFIESVVVPKVQRGKGFGRILMKEAERYAKSRGFKRLCLTTHDKQHFYAHLGYVLSTPVQNAGSMTAFVPMETLLKFSRMPSAGTGVQTRTQVAQGNRDSGGASGPGSPQPSSLPPPPPLPPPSSASIHTPPPPPFIPPSPPALLPLTGQLVIQTLTETPYRDAKGVPIFWMHKDI